MRLPVMSQYPVLYLYNWVLIFALIPAYRLGLDTWRVAAAAAAAASRTDPSTQGRAGMCRK